MGELPQLEHHTLFFACDRTDGFDKIFGENPFIPDPAFISVCKPSGIDRSTAPHGYENLFVLVPIPADPTIGTGDVEGLGDTLIEIIADGVISQISVWAGISYPVSRFSCLASRFSCLVSRVSCLASRLTPRRALGPGDFASDHNAWLGTARGPAHTLAKSPMLRCGNKSEKVERRFYSGSSTIPGIELPMCLISTEVVLKRIRGDRSTEPLAEPLRRMIPC